MRRLCVVFATAVATTLCFAPGASATVPATKTKTKKPGPATAQLTFVGAGGLAGLAPTTQISCDSPNLDGSASIFVLAQPSDPTVLFNMQVAKGKISVGVFSGSGTTFLGRSFEGTGVTGFNAAKGAQINTTLTETTANNPGENPGTLGAIMSIKGSINCGNETAGTSTVTFSGTTADGAVKSKAQPFRVECDTASFGNSVIFPGVVKVGKTKAFFFTTFTPDSINIFETIAGSPPIARQYQVKAAGVSTLSATGATVTGDVVEQSPTSGVAHTLHLTGKVTCGSTVQR
jgi:hypothetical protein